jgi:hypothetical protein
MRIAILLSLLILIGCGPASKLKRAERLIAKAEADGARWTHDTVFVDHPVFIEEVKRDSIFFSLPGDTVRIEKDRLRVTYVRLPGDSVYIEGECKSDTVKIQVPITITNTIESKSGFSWYYLIIAGLVGAGIIALVKRQGSFWTQS